MGKERFGKMFLLVAVILGVAFVLAGWTGKAVAQSAAPVAKQPTYEQALAQWKDIEAKARKEKELVMYVWMLEDAQKAFRAAFKKKYPEIDLKISFMNPREGHTKVKAELASKAPIADFITNVTSLYRSEGAADLFQEPGPLPELLNPKARWKYNPVVGKLVILQTTPVGGVVNTNLCPGDTAPKSYKDLADPKWQGKFSLDDPTVPGLGNSFYHAADMLYGEDLMKKIIENKPVLSQDAPGAVLMVARGEYSFNLGVTTEEVLPRMAPGVPIRMLLFEEGSPSIPIGGIIPKDVRHPNAARVFLNFLLSEEGQGIFGETSFVVPIRGGAKLKFPQYQDIEKIKWLYGIVRTPEMDTKDVPGAREKAKKLLGK